jgi:membrane protein
MRLRNIWTVGKEAGSGWLDDNASQLSAAVALYTILSLAPLLVIVTAIVGWVLGPEVASGQLHQQLRGLLGDGGAEVAKTAVENADKPKAGTLATIIGIATLLYGASGVFSSLQTALNTVWHVKTKPGRGIWGTIRDKFLSFSMVLVVGFLLLVSLAITTALSAVGDYLGNLMPGVPTLLHVVNLVVSFLVVAALFAMIFKYLPDAEISWRDVWFGALVTSALFTLGKYLIGLYLAKAAPGSAFRGGRVGGGVRRVGLLLGPDCLLRSRVDASERGPRRATDRTGGRGRAGRRPGAAETGRRHADGEPRQESHRIAPRSAGDLKRVTR